LAYFFYYRHDYADDDQITYILMKAFYATCKKMIVSLLFLDMSLMVMVSQPSYVWTYTLVLHSCKLSTKRALRAFHSSSNFIIEHALVTWIVCTQKCTGYLFFVVLFSLQQIHMEVLWCTRKFYIWDISKIFDQIFVDCGDWSYTKSGNMETPLMNVKGLYVPVRIQSSNKTI
jgi:hypothetical protein